MYSVVGCEGPAGMDDVLSAECVGGCAVAAESLSDNTKAMALEDCSFAEVTSVSRTVSGEVFVVVREGVCLRRGLVMDMMLISRLRAVILLRVVRRPFICPGPLDIWMLMLLCTLRSTLLRVLCVPGIRVSLLWTWILFTLVLICLSLLSRLRVPFVSVVMSRLIVIALLLFRYLSLFCIVSGRVRTLCMCPVPML